MRHLACVLLLPILLVACKKSEPTKSADPAPTPSATASGGSAPAAPEPAPAEPPAPPPPPPAAKKTPLQGAVDAAIEIFNAVAPVTKKYGDDGEACVKGVAEVDQVLAGMEMQVGLVQAVVKDPDAAKAFYDAYFKQDESPLHEAKSAALGPALHCPALHDRIEETFGIKQAPAKKKK
jgi:hypothetical protein